jgi:hypothetical protein
MMEFRLGRFAAWWRLGEALSKVGRGTGPGRGKKGVSALTSFREVLERLKIDPDSAMNAQRIACLPPEELEAFCASKRESSDLPTFGEEPPGRGLSPPRKSGNE